MSGKENNSNKRGGAEAQQESKNEVWYMSIVNFFFDSIYDVITWVAIAFCVGFTLIFLFQQNWRGVMWSLALLLCCVIAMIAIRADQRFFRGPTPPRAATQQPPLQGRANLNEPTFQQDAGMVTINVGGNIVGWDIAELEKQHKAPVNFGGHSPIQVYVENRTLFVDASIVIPDTNQLFEIRRNSFGVIPIGCDRNATPKAIEIVDRNQIPIFQIVFRAESEILINGIFQGPQGVWIADESGIHGPGRPYQLKRIFRYPAYQHPGEYETNPENPN